MPDVRTMHWTHDERTERPLHETKAGAVLDWIRRGIVMGRLQPGTALQQEEIARQLNVSSTPVREALATLEAAGYVKRRPHRGAVVLAPEPAEMVELLALRLTVERHALERVLGRDDARARAAHAAILHLCAAALGDSAAALEREADEDVFMSAIAFHEGLLRGTGIRMLLDLSEVLLARGLRELHNDRASWRADHEEHGTIFRAIEQRDLATAQRVLDEHTRRYAPDAVRSR